MTHRIRVLDLLSVIYSSDFVLSPADEEKYKANESQAAELVHQILQGFAVLSLGVKYLGTGPQQVFQGQQDLVNLRWAFSEKGLRLGTAAADAKDTDVRSYLIAAVNLNTSEGLLLKDGINTVPLLKWQRSTNLDRTPWSDKVANTLRSYPISLFEHRDNWL